MLTERQAKLLDFIVREHVRSAEPVGSAAVVEKSGFGVSPATIRSEMQALENFDYVTQPHTSAGRVPTEKAYRWFVNTLLAQQDYEIANKDKKKIDEAVLTAGDDPRQINKTMAQVLSELSEHAVITNIKEAKDFYKTGLASLMEIPEFREFDRIFQLTSFFEDFDELFGHMEQELMSALEENFNVFIGHESPFRNIQGEAVIVIHYQLPHQNSGTLTLIGPTRMDYRRNIGLVTYASQLLNKIAKQYN